MYYAQSFTKKPVTVASNFSNAEEEELYHAQSQEQPRPASLAFPKFMLNDQSTHLQTPPASPRAHVGISNVKKATNLRPKHPTLQPMTGFEHQQEPFFLEESDDTTILPEV